MRVLVFATAYPRSTSDVITPWLVEMIQHLKTRSIAVEVLTSSYRGLKSHYHKGVKVHRFRYGPSFLEVLTHERTAIDRVKESPFFIFLAILYIIFGSMAMVRLLRKRDYDVVHINWPIPHIIFGIIGRMARRFKLIVSFHGVEIRWLKRDLAFFLPFFKALLKKADWVTTNSTHTKGELPDGIDAEVIPFGTSVKPRSGGAEEDYILFVGRLVERKGVEFLIRAFDRIKDQVLDRLVIVGSGPLYDGLRNLTNSFNLQARVQFTGFISGGELDRVISHCKVFCLPAVVDRKGDTEGLGVVLIEALEYGKPVIASRVGGITDVIIDGRTGILVRPGDVDALAQVLLRLIEDKELRRRLGEEGKRYVEERFSWSRITDRLIALYE
ncbi:MAG TPA: glycosyltransferase family 1 protein [bacterium (Candidatus Stahlbacteria)]|nr:glycosyltransferase family 1 protein [Candidatus Stahlbacteria bacterium]